MMLHIHKSTAGLNEAAATYFVNQAKQAMAARGKFTVALTGGSSPGGMYHLLATTYADAVDWSKVYIFWGDERWVPLTDDRSNAGNAFKDFLNSVPIPEEQIFTMWKEGVEPEVFADTYAKYLEDVLENGEVFDLVFLGMGDDGHTLSLFPNEDVIDEKAKKVVAYFLKPQDMYRITLTAPLVNRAHEIAFLVFGDKKANALYEVLKGEPNVKKYPSQIIKPIAGEVRWFVDENAAKLL